MTSPVSRDDDNRMDFLKRPHTIPFLLVLALTAGACTIEVGAHTLTVEQAQEDGFLQNGDEPYVAVIKWRVIPGTADSASAEFIGNLVELATGADDDDELSIPSNMGEVDFEDVQHSNINALLNDGTVPELVGTVMVVMESDLTSWSTINNLMEDVESALETELVNEVEPLTIAQLTNSQDIADALSTAAENIEDEVTPGVLDSILLWLGSFGNPDDLIGVGYTVWAAATGPLGTLIETTMESALPDNAVGGVWSTDVTDKDVSITFTGNDAIYEVDITATMS